MQNNYFYKWIDSNKDDEINSFKECIDSYIYFKKDAFYKTNKLIKKKPEFNAPKLLKIVLLLFSRDVQKISLARETLKSISTDEVNDYFHQYLEIVNLWIKNDLKNLLNKLELIIKDNPKDIFAIRLFHFNNIFLGIDGKFLDKHKDRSFIAFNPPTPVNAFAFLVLTNNALIFLDLIFLFHLIFSDIALD